MKSKSKSKNQSKKQKKSQPVVVRLLKGGSCAAPDVVSHYISPPNSNIPAGYGGVESIFRRVFYSPGPAATQSAGGFMVDPAITIGKVPVVHPYAPRAEPVILNGEVHLSCQSQCGSGKISSNKVKVNKMTQRKLKHTKVSKKKLSARKDRKTKRRHRSRTTRSKKQHQRGGKEGEPGNFSPDMMTRDFSGKQPEWNPNTI